MDADMIMNNVVIEEIFRTSLDYMHNNVPMYMLDIVKCLLIEFQDITFENIAKIWLLIRLQECVCLEGLETRLICLAVVHCLKILACDLTCEYVILSYEYAIMHSGQFPSLMEMELLERNHQLIQDNPDDYHDANKVIVPTPNLENLKMIKVTDETECALCQDRLFQNMDAYEVPCCKNIFHALGSDCIDKKTIVDWLKTSRKCPVCNSLMIII